MSIPVYLSRHTPDLPEKYGSFVSWNIGERVQFIPAVGGEAKSGTIQSETLTHVEAPTIDGARGSGKWVREVICDDTGEKAAVSEERLEFIDAARSSNDT